MIGKLFRGLFTLIGLGVGTGAFALFELLCENNEAFSWGLGIIQGTKEIYLYVTFAFIFGLIFYILAPVFRKQGHKVADNISEDLRSVPTENVISGSLGLVVGLAAAYLISQIYAMINIPILSVILTVLTYITFAYLGTVVVGRRGAQLKPFIPGINKSEEVQTGKKKFKNVSQCPKILDTSVIIDGRIYDIMKTGFLEGLIVIPEFVILELQHIADSSDSLKRARGRRGLDIVKKIQMEFGIDVYDSSSEKSLGEIPEVDIKLLKLAQIMNGKVVTNDFNLNKVAAIKGVDVLNINELANTLKPVVLPGEYMTLFLLKEGKESDQAVAYLDDGTMIVVEGGRKYIGKTIDALVTSVLQTSAGRMIFAKPKGK